MKFKIFFTRIIFLIVILVGVLICGYFGSSIGGEVAFTVSLLLGLFIGGLVAFLITRIIFKKQKQEIEKNCADKIIKQDNSFFMGNQKYDLKKDIQDQIGGKPPIELEPAPTIKPKTISKKPSPGKIPSKKKGRNKGTKKKGG